MNYKQIMAVVHVQLKNSSARVSIKTNNGSLVVVQCARAARITVAFVHV